MIKNKQVIKELLNDIKIKSEMLNDLKIDNIVIKTAIGSLLECTQLAMYELRDNKEQ